MHACLIRSSWTFHCLLAALLNRFKCRRLLIHCVCICAVSYSVSFDIMVSESKKKRLEKKAKEGKLKPSKSAASIASRNGSVSDVDVLSQQMEEDLGLNDRATTGILTSHPQ